MNSEQYNNSKVKILGKSCARKPSVVFLTFHTFACKLAGKNYWQMYGKLKCDLSFLALLKFGQYNLLPSILTQLFISCSEFIFLWKLYAIRFPYKQSKFGADNCQSTQNAISVTIFWILRIQKWVQNFWWQPLTYRNSSQAINLRLRELSACKRFLDKPVL